MKKIIIISITTIILILFILFGIYFISNKELSKDEFITLMEKFENVSNVKLEGTPTTYKKDNFILVIYTDDIYSWSDTKTNEHIRYSSTLKQYAFMDTSSSDDNSSEIQDSLYTFIRL